MILGSLTAWALLNSLMRSRASFQKILVSGAEHGKGPVLIRIANRYAEAEHE